MNAPIMVLAFELDQGIAILPASTTSANQRRFPKSVSDRSTYVIHYFQCFKNGKTRHCSAPLSCHTSDQDFNRSSWGRQVPRAGRVYAGGVM